MSNTPGPPSPWDQRFAGRDYLYGTAPNDFLAAQVHQLRGPVLSLAEGEGRNAVFMASCGLQVLGVDRSAVGLAKAHQLATRRGVAIQTLQADLADYTPPANTFGAVVSIFAHLPGALRQRLYPRLQQALKPGGVLLMEAYTEAQLGRGTGGPPTADLMMNPAKIRDELAGLDIDLLQVLERDVIEGSGHTGRASVVQYIGRKPA